MKLENFGIKRRTLILIASLVALDFFFCGAYYCKVISFYMHHLGIGKSTGGYLLTGPLLCGFPAAVLFFTFLKEEYLLFRKMLAVWLIIKSCSILFMPLFRDLESYYHYGIDLPKGLGPINLLDWNAACFVLILVLGWGNWKKILKDLR